MMIYLDSFQGQRTVKIYTNHQLFPSQPLDLDTKQVT